MSQEYKEPGIDENAIEQGETLPPVENFLSARSSVQRENLRLLGLNADGTQTKSTFAFGNMDESRAAGDLHGRWLSNVESRAELVAEPTIEETNMTPGTISNIQCFVTVNGEKLSFNYSDPKTGMIDSKGNMYMVEVPMTPLSFSQSVSEGHEMRASEKEMKVKVYKVPSDHPSKNWKAV
jgi:hypothetical protein